MNSLLSVVLPVFNGEPFIAKAVESILAQTYKDFEFIIIDDGSTDRSLELIQDYARQDSRIKIISRENKGLVETLNEGIELAKGTYIARQDADDISKPNRFEIQVEQLTKNPKTVIIGSSIEVMDSAGNILHEHRILLNDPELRQELLVRSPFAHGSVIFRRDAALAAGLYRKDYWPAEDYDFWLRLSSMGNLANIDEPLYVYREHDESTSVTLQEEQIKQADRIRKDAWSQIDRLLRGRINISKYKKLAHSKHRVPRIFDNISVTYKQAKQGGSLSTAMKIVGMVAADRATYRKIIGNLKRKIVKA